mgnify:CR=1 FL=1
MSERKNPYKVLARKYRPESFAELRGQDTMVRILKNGGLLLVVDHDSFTSAYYMLKDIEHGLYMNVYNNSDESNLNVPSTNAVFVNVPSKSGCSDTDVIEFLRGLIKEIDENDWSKNVLITLISDAGTRTFAVEAGGSQESFREITAEFSG